MTDQPKRSRWKRRALLLALAILLYVGCFGPVNAHFMYHDITEVTPNWTTRILAQWSRVFYWPLFQLEDISPTFKSFSYGYVKLIHSWFYDLEW